ncbi:MAG: hypothetical protein AAFV95_00520 [Bacteroidota bacterium]
MNKAITSIFLCVLLLSACSTMETYHIQGVKSDEHELIRNTNVMVKLVGDYTKATSFNGFQDIREQWSISSKKSGKTLEQLEKTYDAKTLSKRDRELMEMKHVSYQGTYEGVYVKYKEFRRSRIRYLIGIKGEGQVTLVQGWYREAGGEELEKIYEDMLATIYLASEEDVAVFDQLDKKPNKKFSYYEYKGEHFQFVGELDRKYYYTKDGLYPTSSTDSCTIWFRPIWNTSPGKLREEMLARHFAGQYEIIFLKKDEDEGVKSYDYWAAKSTVNDKMVFGGFNWSSNINIFEGFCYGNHEENLEKFEEIRQSIRYRE